MMILNIFFKISKNYFFADKNVQTQRHDLFLENLVFTLHNDLELFRNLNLTYEYMMKVN